VDLISEFLKNTVRAGHFDSVMVLASYCQWAFGIFSIESSPMPGSQWKRLSRVMRSASFQFFSFSKILPVHPLDTSKATWSYAHMANSPVHELTMIK